MESGMESILSSLNPEQLSAVTATEGYVRVVAGAGSGKTRALARRFAYLVCGVGVPGENILCVTFTNKSASEMRERIRILTGDASGGYIATFHSFCVSVLQEDISALGYPKSFLVLDNSDIDAMLRTIYEERSLSMRDMTFAAARDMIEIRKCVKEPEYYEYVLALPLDELKAKYAAATEAQDVIFYGYLYEAKKCFGLDYNDLINFVLYLFGIDDAIREKWQNRLEYIMIDEFQDIDAQQYGLMEVLSAHHKNLFIVGDPDQTIYTWRGADVRLLLDFDKKFPSARTVMMMKNYRSTPEILAVANSLISNNRHRMEKNLAATLPSGERPTYFHAPTAEDEAAEIARKVRELEKGGANLSDIAVLYRAHYVSRPVEEAFLKADIPYAIYSGVRFYDRAEIKDALSYLRLTVYGDDLSFLRVVNNPKRNIGDRRIRFLKEYAEANSCSLLAALERSVDDELFHRTGARKFLALIASFRAMLALPASELVAGLIDKSGYEAALRTEGSQERLDNLAELKQAVHEFEISCGEEASAEHYLSHVSLLTNLDAGRGKEGVRLMTVHSAKGLEFPYVFVPGLSEGVFPSKKTTTLPAMEEERRIAFVAFTRAEKGLYLSDSEGRNLDGSFRCPSRFIFNIERSLLDFTGDLNEKLIDEAKWRIAAAEKGLLAAAPEPLFSPGERIVHSIMGRGVVTGIDRDKGAYIIAFDDLATERRISFSIKLARG